jgi:hypothetical protein
MANATTEITLLDGDRNVVILANGVLDTSNVSPARTIVDVSTLLPLPTGIRLDKVTYSISSQLSVQLAWDATADVICLTIGEDQFQAHDFSDYGGIPNNSGAGKTGDVVFTTIGAAAGDRYTIILELSKNYG